MKLARGFARITLAAICATAILTTGCVAAPHDGFPWFYLGKKPAKHEPAIIDQARKAWADVDPMRKAAAPRVDQIPPNTDPETRQMLEGIMKDFKARGGNPDNWKIEVIK